MIEKYVPSDKHYDDFHQRFMERWVQKLNDPKQTTTFDWIPFPTVALPSTPTFLPTKRISNTSDDSGTNSAPAFSPTTLPSLIKHSPQGYKLWKLVTFN